MERARTTEGLVSVVIPTHYRNDRLREAIESVRQQEYRPVEVLVVDGADDDHARPVVEAFEGVTYVRQERDEGPQAARSIGAERANGEYVQLLDDDDRLAPSKIRKQVERFESVGESPVGVVYCGMRDESRGEILPNPVVRGDVLERALEMRTFPCITSTMLIDADVLAGMLPLGHRHGADDTGTKIELAMRTRFDFVNEPLVDRGVTETPLSASWSYLEGRKRVVEVYEDVYRQFPPRVRRRAVRETHYLIGRKLLAERRWSAEAVLEFARAAYYTPENRGYYLGELLASAFGRPGLRVADGLLGT